VNPPRDGGRVSDEELIIVIRRMFEATDPMPPGLPDRIRFALALRDLEAEVARYADPANELALAARGVEESRTVTFDSDSLTIMIRVDTNPDGSARIDGWLAPPSPKIVEMKMTDDSLCVNADESGRFVFPSVPRGPARLLVRAPAESNPDPLADGAKSVITPTLTLLRRE
jgi:hypothetical protein